MSLVFGGLWSFRLLQAKLTFRSLCVRKRMRIMDGNSWHGDAVHMNVVFEEEMSKGVPSFGETCEEHGFKTARPPPLGILWPHR